MSIFHKLYLLYVVLLTSMLPNSSAISVAAVGDSIVQGRTDRTAWGWGQTLPGFFAPDVEFYNLGAGGTSTKTYIEEGLWDKVLAIEADYVIIQFGHNDQKSGERFTNPNSTFRENLHRFISDIRGYGGVPVLVTPPIRRLWNDDGTLYSTQLPWVQAVRIVAEEASVFCVDLFEITQDYYEYIGQSASVSYQPPGDDSHYSRLGATHLARMIAYQVATHRPSGYEELVNNLRLSADSLIVSATQDSERWDLEWSTDLIEWRVYDSWEGGLNSAELALHIEHAGNETSLFARAKEHGSMHIVVVAGQSNAVGTDLDGTSLTSLEHDQEIQFSVLAGSYPQDYQYPEDGRPSMKYNSNQEILNFSTVDRLGGFGVERGFARQLADKGIGDILVLKVAVNGRGLGRYWMKSDPSGLGLYDLLVDEVRNVVDQLAGVGIDSHIAAILWPQYANDGNRLDTATAYGENLLEFAADLRADLPGAEGDTPFIMLECPEWANPPYADIVRAQGAVFSANDPYGWMIPSSELLHMGDRIHLTSESKELVGIRMADVWLKEQAKRLIESVSVQIKSVETPRIEPVPAYVVIGGKNAELISKYEFEVGGKDLPSLLHVVDVNLDNNWAFGRSLSRRSVGFRLFRVMMERQGESPICVIRHSFDEWSLEQDANPMNEAGDWYLSGLPAIKTWFDWSPYPLQLQAILIIQGEEGGDYAGSSYYTNLRAMVISVLEEFPGVPVIISEVADNSSEAFEQLNEDTNRVADEFSDVWLVSSNNLPLGSDGKTFTSSGVAEMAERMISAIPSE